MNIKYVDLAEAEGEAPVNEKHCNREIQLELSLISLVSGKLKKNHVTLMGRQLSPRYGIL